MKISYTIKFLCVHSIHYLSVALYSCNFCFHLNASSSIFEVLSTAKLKRICCCCYFKKSQNSCHPRSVITLSHWPKKAGSRLVTLASRPMTGTWKRNRPFAASDHVVQNRPCWRASSLLFPLWDIKTKRPEPVKLDLPLF